MPLEIVEGYRDYKPVVPAKRIVRLLLGYIPRKYLVGLKTIVLRNQTGPGRKRGSRMKPSRRRRNKNRTLGLYYPKRRGMAAHIVIFVDNLERDVPRLLLRLPVIRNLLFAWVLYHEIGHHIHATKRPRYKNPEVVADEWSLKFMRRFAARKYWYLIWIPYVFRLFRTKT
jgi:hypothetical protein